MAIDSRHNHSRAMLDVSDPVTLRFSMTAVLSLRRVPRPAGGRQRTETAGDGMSRRRSVAVPPSPAEVERRFRASLSAVAATAPARRTPLKPRLVMANVEGQPHLAVSGASDGELTLWRRGTERADPRALATLRLDHNGSQLLARGRVAGLLHEAEDRAVLHPDWLREIGAAGPEPREENPQSPLEARPEPLQILQPRSRAP